MRLPATTARLAAGVLAAVASAPLGAQTAPSASRGPEVPAALSAVREADLRRDVTEMASPAMRGREGGTVDEMRASMWLAEQYRRIGLQPMGEGGTWFQWVDMIRTRVSTAGSRASVGGQAMTLFRDLVPLNVVPAEAAGAVLWVADAADSTVEVRGRVVATPLLAPPPAAIRANSYTFASRYADAAVNATLARFQRRGAAAVLLVASPAVDSAFEVVASARSRGSYDVDDAVPRAADGPRRVGPPPALGAGATPAYLVRASMRDALAQQPQAELSVRVERFTTPTVNVIGGVRGTDPALRDEYVVFSSHQDANGVRVTLEGDSVHAGADDNATVTAAGLAAARAFVRQPGRRSVLFINHGAEERGLIGSRWHAAHPVVPLERIVAVLNGDMIGRNHPDSASLLGAQPPHRNSSDLVAMALRANALTGRFTLDSLWDRPTHPEGWYFRSDHLPYARLNVPALMYTTNLHDDYHTPRDDAGRIDYPKLTRMARWMYLTGWFVATAPRRPALDPGFRLER
ncbi:M28 family peptidase [Roseisolibacter sp. H3M3-2]|uniref:M28 family metallopeptidase n=1 Tax=Roseisolibacter sp. H3M3-2 TaxID=3031323 RepID=UPI0023DBDBD5|nr:M28 family peptidase [Roseisolibacter sp. H3M3-2]MDF1502951.1 M28 family peptidase [Roseisolibacter sp. H3M3-2]